MMAAVKTDRVFQALGDPTRRAILELVTERAVSLSHLAVPLDISVAAVVQHVQVLEEAQLVRTQKTGRVRSCRIDPKGIAAAMAWLEARRTLWERRLDRLDEVLKDG
jgi:DNA-binding transcriptional ArsR family regulator